MRQHARRPARPQGTQVTRPATRSGVQSRRVKRPPTPIQKLRQITLIQAELTPTQLADAIGESWQAVSAVLRGSFRSVDRIEPKILEELGRRLGRKHVPDLFPPPGADLPEEARALPRPRLRSA